MLTKFQLKKIDIEVGALVKRVRGGRQMSQERLAKELGISYHQLQKYENGTNRISASRLVQIAKVFGMMPGYFVDGVMKRD